MKKEHCFSRLARCSLLPSFAVLLIVTIFTLAGCETGTDDGSGITPVDIAPEELVGKWVGTI